MGMTTEMAFDAIEKLLPHLAAVMNDVDIRAVTELVNADAESRPKVGDLMQQLLPLLVTKHREHMYHIVACFKGITPEEAATLDFHDTAMALKENFMGDMVLFFAQSLRMVNVQ